MKAVPFLLILLATQSSFADDPGCDNHMDCEARIISENGLKPRAHPHRNSAALALVPFWSKVEVCRDIHVPDTIQEVVASWRKVRYGKIVGYMFDAYFVEVDSATEAKADFRIMLAGHNSRVNYDPALHWYGIFETETGDSLLKVKVTFENVHNEMEHKNTLVSVNNDLKAIFLFGMRKEVPDNFFSRRRHQESHFLYPGQSQEVYSPGLLLYATGTVKDIDHCEFENYRLHVKDRTNNPRKQDITGEFTEFGECHHIELMWFGDVDGDYLPDMLFYAQAMYGSYYTLLVSSIAPSGKFLKRAAWLDVFHDCC